MGFGKTAFQIGEAAIPGVGWGVAGVDAATGGKISGGAGDAIDSATGAATDAVGDAFSPVYDPGKYSPYQFDPSMGHLGEGMSKPAHDYQTFLTDQGIDQKGMQHTAFNGYVNGLGQNSSTPNQTLLNNEATARGYDQAGALDLQRRAAMGQSPSQAAYLMQSGLDQGLANQQAIAGGARGAAGVALAGGNMAGNSANLQNQAFTQAGAMRANEMAQAQSQYGQLATNVRGQDQSLLGQDLQNQQYNLGNDTTGRLGSLNGSVGIGGTQLGYDKAGGDIMTNAGQLGVQGGQVASNAYGDAMGLNAGVTTGNADRKQQSKDRTVDTVIGLGKTGAGMAFGGSKPT